MGEKDTKSAGTEGSGQSIVNKEDAVQVRVASPVGKVSLEDLVDKAGTDSSVDVVGSVSAVKNGNDWSLVTSDKVGRAQTPLRDAGEVLFLASKYSVSSVDEVEEGEIAETLEVVEDGSVGVESTEILEGELLEDEILDQKTKEKDKTAMQKGGRRVQKTKAQEVQPKSKRSSRRKL